MQRLMRSLFLLSLTAAPLAVAGTAAPVPASTESVVSSTAPDSTSARLDAIHENALLQAHVQDLEATVSGMRKALQRIRDEEEARARVIGDPNVHPLWP